MKRLWLSLFLLFTIAGTVTALEDPAATVSATQYQQRLRATQPAANPAAAAAALSRADRFAGQKLWSDAVGDYEAAIAAGDNRAEVWLRLSAAWRQRGDDFRARAFEAAWNAYLVAKSPDQRARALFVLGDLYQQRQDFPQALAAFKEGLGLEENPEVAKHYQQLLAATAFQAKGVEVNTDNATPRVCLEFSEPLKKDRQLHYEDYLTLKPAVPMAVNVHGSQLCIEGMQHGRKYEITVRPGLPAAGGAQLVNGASFTADVGDREPTLGFRGATYILPRAGSQNVPLTSVNFSNARLRLLRINDRNLTQQINERRVTGSLDSYDVDAIAKQSGELLWEGELSIQGERNQEVTTAVPINEILKDPKPGIYVLVASRAHLPEDEWEEPASQWLVVSDLGLATFQGKDGLHVFARSLDSAKPLRGVELRLYARNNGELGKATTDGQGYARFDPGLLRGGGGREPAAVMAYYGEQDFNFIDLTRPAFDLSDRGVDGREAPGRLDAFFYSDRGVYRPGEAVELMALLRDDRGYALADPFPLTLVFTRPDQVEAQRLTLTAAAGGGYYTRFPLAVTARTGTWTVRAYTDPKGAAVGELKFQVEDFVPQRLKLELSTAAGRLEPGQSAVVDVNGRFLYGAPAADLKTEAELVLADDPEPYPDFKGYRFGLVQEEWQAKQFPVTLANTNAQGKTQAQIELDEIPDVSRLLKATLRVSLFEPGGRPVSRSLTLPYRTQPFAIGIRPQFGEDSVPLGQSAGFSVVALDPAGRPLAKAGLRAELYREEYQYYWYHTDNRWDYKLVLRESQPLAKQDLNVTAEQPAVLTQAKLDWGDYRLEIYDPNSAVASSVRFQVGWMAKPSDRDSPDQLKITLEKPRYSSGETAKVQIKAPFAGEVLLTAVGNQLWSSQSVRLPAEGTVVELDVPEEWSPGVYLTATAFRPAKSGDRGPGRAVGVTWLGLDPAPRRLNLSLDMPAEVRPRQTVEIPVKVTGPDQVESAWVTLAAVDEGILQLTDYSSPHPVDYFLGKRKLGMDLRDVYGRLIEAGGAPGKLRSGGDTDRQLKGPGVTTVKTVALFSGPVALDAQGQARIPLNLPDFNGELRLMAVAWDAQRLGQADRPLLVRDPLVAQVYLPRFLAPDDLSQLTVNLQNLSAPAGNYRVRLISEGAVYLTGQPDFEFPVADSAVQNAERKVFGLVGRTPGVGHIYLNIEGPGGFALSQNWEIGVRPAQTVISERRALRLAPSEGIVANTDLLKAFLPGTGEIALSFSSRPNLNVAGLLQQLSRYPYGCVEQTTSAALPLLYFDQVVAAWGIQQTDAAGLRNRVQGAVQRVLSMQQVDGGFGLWNLNNPVDIWLSAYAMDFLGRAKQAGYLVPEEAYRRGLERLQQVLATNEFEELNQLVNRAFVLYVLARADQAALGDLRYLHDNHLRRLPTALARAQLGAALARYGERGRAEEAFRAALEPLPPERNAFRDYGTPLRDQAAVVALLAESGLLPQQVPQLAEALAATYYQRPYTSTQEQVWLLLAANALIKERGQLELNVNGGRVTPAQEPLVITPTPAQLAQGFKVANQGTTSVWYVANLSGIPAEILPPAQEGFSVVRRFYNRAGQVVDPVKLKQNDLLVAVISGEAKTPIPHQALIVDLLPAGLEIENARLANTQSKDQFDWLPDLSETLHEEFRDDRYVAALDLSKDQQQFTVAYLVRVVTPGEYRLPAVFVEDMYQPWYFGRGDHGKLKIE